MEASFLKQRNSTYPLTILQTQPTPLSHVMFCSHIGGSMLQEDDDSSLKAFKCTCSSFPADGSRCLKNSAPVLLNTEALIAKRSQLNLMDFHVLFFKIHASTLAVTINLLPLDRKQRKTVCGSITLRVEF